MKTRKMKDSGVEWLGSVPEGWKIDRIGSFYTHRNEKVSDKDYPPLSVTMKGIVPQLETAAKTDDGDNRKLVRKGDFAINSRSDRRGSCGISAYEGSVSLINTILAPRGDMSPEYYNWLFHTAAFADEFYKWGHGIVDDLWTTRWTEMKRIAIVHPSLHEQRAIAAYLDKRCAKIDAMVADAKKLIEEYKQWKASIIFEAVTGKVDVKSGKLRAKGELRDSGVEWIGQVPEGWKIQRFKFVVSKLRKGSGITKEEVFEDGDVPCVRYGEIYSKYAYSFDECYSRTRIELQAERVDVNKGDILFACTGELVEEIGKNIVYLGSSPCVAGGDIMVASHNQNSVFLNYYLNCHSSQYQKSRNKAKLKVVHVKTSDIENLIVLLPLLPEQRAIAAYLDRKCAAIDRVVAEKEGLIADLERYKKSLIFECVTGKREVA